MSIRYRMRPMNHPAGVNPLRSTLSLALLNLLIFPMACTSAPASSSRWPGWRGDGSAIAVAENAPIAWDAENGIAWKTHIAGEGNSSPIIWEDRAFLTASTEGGLTRLIICLDAHSGDILWQTQLEADQTSTYPKSGRASSTPVTDGTYVYAFFDSPGLVVVDFDGNIKWIKELGPFSNPYNMAASPTLYKDMVIMSCDHSGPSFIAAFDKETSQQRWRTDRKGGTHYSSPIVFEHEGVTQIVVSGEPIVGYNADTGEELWQFHGMKHAVTPTAIYKNNLLYATCGRNGPSVVLDPAGRGDITNTHLKMHLSSGGPYVPSPLVMDDIFVIPGDNGRMMFADLDGNVLARHRVRAKVRKFTSSPLLCAGHIYWQDETGRTHVVRATGFDGEKPTIEDVASNPLDETCLASPAFAHGRLYIRTAKHLFSIAGGDVKLESPDVVELPDDFDELKKLYDAQPKAELDDTNLRISMIQKLASFDTDEAVELLGHVAASGEHWDVTEEAIRLMGDYGQRAVPTLIDMFKPGRQPFLKTVAADHLANLKAPEATDTLITAARSEQVHVRVGCIKALASIGVAHQDVAGRINTTMVDLCFAADGVVRHAATEALGWLAPTAGPYRAVMVAALRRRLADSHALTADAAKMAIERLYREPLDPPTPTTPSTIAADAKLIEVYAASAAFEGPAWDRAANTLYFAAMGSGMSLMRLDAAGDVATVLPESNGINGCFLSKDGRLLCAEYSGHRVVSYAMTADGLTDLKVLAENPQWHQPNDLCQTPRGDIYFTDPDFNGFETSAVYRLSPDGQVTKVASDIACPNGIVASPNGQTLYVSDSKNRSWRAYPIAEDGSVGPGRMFFISNTPEHRETDGMTVDESGNVYMTGGDGLWVVAPDSRPLGMFPIPEFATNVTFGGPNADHLYITCRGKVYSLKTKVRAPR